MSSLKAGVWRVGRGITHGIGLVLETASTVHATNTAGRNGTWT